MRQRKVALYADLVERTIAPVGKRWQAAMAAVHLRDAEQQSERVADVLDWWEQLLNR